MIKIRIGLLLLLLCGAVFAEELKTSNGLVVFEGNGHILSNCKRCADTSLAKNKSESRKGCDTVSLNYGIRCACGIMVGGIRLAVKKVKLAERITTSDSIRVICCKGMSDLCNIIRGGKREDLEIGFGKLDGSKSEWYIQPKAQGADRVGQTNK